MSVIMKEHMPSVLQNSEFDSGYYVALCSITSCAIVYPVVFQHS